jgi:hypothetical protein
MKYDRVYEVVDYRQIDPTRRLGVVGAFRCNPGAVEVVSVNGRGFVIEDDFGFDDDHEHGIVAMSTPDGRVTLTELTLERYHDTIEPFMRGAVPEFVDGQQLHRHFLKMILEA